MMKRRIYTIYGIEEGMVKNWKDYLRKDLKLIKNRKTGEIKGEVSLTIFEAMKIRLAMIKCNLSHPCLFKLKRNKGLKKVNKTRV